MEVAKEKIGHFLCRLFCPKEIFLTFVFMPIYNVLDTLSEYTYFYVWINVTLYTFLLVFKIVESAQSILEEKGNICQILLTFYEMYRSSRLQMCFKLVVLCNILCKILQHSRERTWVRPATLLKRDSNRGVLLRILRIF